MSEKIMYKDQDGLNRHASLDDSITGKDGDKIHVGDTVLYTNNPFCKPSEVVDFFQDQIITSDGRGDAHHYKLVSLRRYAHGLTRNKFR